MRFFYQQIYQVNLAGNDSIKSKDMVDEDNGKEEGQGDVESDRNTDEADSGRIGGHIWLACIEAVKDLTGFNFERVMNMPAIEFFTYLSYINYKKRKEEQQLIKLRAKHR